MTEQNIPSLLDAAEVIATVAVKDIAAARKFYGELLGLAEIAHVDSEVVVYKCGDSKLNVYHSELAGTNQATSVTWSVTGDIVRLVEDLKAKGIRFEHYKMPDVVLEGDLHVAKGMKAAWFKDPDGNILNLACTDMLSGERPKADEDVSMVKAA